MVLLTALALALNCSDGPAIHEAWRPALEAYNSGDMTRAKAVTEAILVACPTAPLIAGPRVMRADIADKELDHDGALAALQGVERPSAAAMGTLPSFIALRSWQGKQDAEGFAQERRRLADGVEKQLTDPDGRVKARLIEHFEIGDMTVSAIEGDYRNGDFVRHTTFVVQSSKPFAPLRTIMLTTSPASALLGGSKVYFLDEYSCARHVTLEVIPRRKPKYRALRSRVEAHLSGSATGVSSTEAGDQGCAFANYVAPGYEP